MSLDFWNIFLSFFGIFLKFRQTSKLSRKPEQTQKSRQKSKISPHTDEKYNLQSFLELFFQCFLIFFLEFISVSLDFWNIFLSFFGIFLKFCQTSKLSRKTEQTQKSPQNKKSRHIRMKNKICNPF